MRVRMVVDVRVFVFIFVLLGMVQASWVSSLQGTLTIFWSGGGSLLYILVPLGLGGGGTLLRLKVNSHATNPLQTIMHMVTFRAHVIMLVFWLAQRGLPQTPLLIMHAG